MAYRRRSANRLAKKSKRNFIVTLIIVGLLGYSTLTWILPSLIGGISVVKNVVKPSQKTTAPITQGSTLAPPVLSISYEATNSAQIDIKGYGIPELKVKLFIDDKDTQTADVSSDGSFIFENVSLSLGTNNIYGKSVDDQGKESLPSKTIKLTFVNEKPTLSINEPEDNKIIEGGDKKVKISGKTDPGVKIYINNSQAILDKDGNFSNEQPLNDGDNNFDIKAVDLASNTSEVQRRVIFKPQETQ
ncbi:hypothetical protein HYT74_03160 [Candidatus Daviesbacteria bacterium]|nr:hypothetical protein [Candidatus Daviesbacteria bacterium]